MDYSFQAPCDFAVWARTQIREGNTAVYELSENGSYILEGVVGGRMQHVRLPFWLGYRLTEKWRRERQLHRVGAQTIAQIVRMAQQVFYDPVLKRIET